MGQCDQMVRLFFIFLPFPAMKISPIKPLICKSMFSILPKTWKLLPKWQNFAKSGHTDHGLSVQVSWRVLENFPLPRFIFPNWICSKWRWSDVKWVRLPLRGSDVPPLPPKAFLFHFFSVDAFWRNGGRQTQILFWRSGGRQKQFSVCLMTMELFRSYEAWNGCMCCFNFCYFYHFATYYSFPLLCPAQFDPLLFHLHGKFFQPTLGSSLGSAYLL